MYLILLFSQQFHFCCYRTFWQELAVSLGMFYCVVGRKREEKSYIIRELPVLAKAW